jgi:hypothetical protein
LDDRVVRADAAPAVAGLGARVGDHPPIDADPPPLYRGGTSAPEQAEKTLAPKIKRSTRNADNVSSMPSTRHRPPLTREQLHVIGARNRGNADVHALLWEIRRLRAITLHADQLLRLMPGPSVGTLGLIADAWRFRVRAAPGGKNWRLSAYHATRSRGSGKIRLGNPPSALQLRDINSSQRGLPQ